MADRDMSPSAVIARAEQLQKALKIISSKVRELKSDLGVMSPPPPEAQMDSMHSTLFYLDAHADDLYLQLGKLTK